MMLRIMARVGSPGSGDRDAVLRAFSLAEMLALLSLVAATLALAPPTLRYVRSDEHLAACLGNLRALGSASLTYAAEDPREMFIPVPALEVLDAASGAFEWGGKAGRGQSSVPDDITYSHFGTRSYRGPAHRPLNPHLYAGGFTNWNPVGGTPNPGEGNANYLGDANLDLGFYRCPADTGYAGGGFLYTAGTRPDRNERAFRDEGYTAYDHYGTSYAAPTLYIVGGLAGSQFRSQSLYLTPLSRIQAPAHQVAYQEIPSRFAWIWGDWSTEGVCDYSNRVVNNFVAIPGWHGRPFSFNLAFADGHAATIEMQGTFRPAPNIGALAYPPDECGTGTNPYECMRCVTFRGPGWQLDSLPAEPVFTNWYSADRSVAVEEVTP